jgi:phospholipid N-methyltransferase
LKTTLPDVKIINANACELDKLCEAENIESLDAVLSGLPWASFPAALQQAILTAVISSLKPGGKFSTFAYLQGMVMPGGVHFRKLLQKEFSQVTFSRVIWKNLPPAVVYRCIK